MAGGFAGTKSGREQNGTVTLRWNEPNAGWTVLGAGGIANGNKGKAQGDAGLDRVPDEAAYGGAGIAGRSELRTGQR